MLLLKRFKLITDPELLINSPESDEDLFDIGYPPSTAQQSDHSQASERSRLRSAISIDPRLCLRRQRGQTIGAVTGTASSNLPTTGSLPHPQPPATHRGSLYTPLGRICKRSSNSGSGQSSDFNVS
ncbi:hypothetical protein NQZ68_035550 [Dissostichus eleginoides]|nr:hypothetical protein NQZ68_035550 [Dissostichus eleginoides]